MSAQRGPQPPAVSRQVRLRLRRTRLVVFAVLLFMWAWLIGMQGLTDPGLYADIASRDQVVQELPALRGSITDRNGVVLATTVNSREVSADPSMIQDPTGVASKLAPLLKVDAATLASALSRSGRYALLARDVSPATWQTISEMGIPGVFSRGSVDRVYPEGKLAANLLGFMHSDGTAGGGLEYKYDKELSGTPGTRSYYSSGGAAPGNVRVVPAVDGETVRLTIDRDIQWLAQQAITQRVKEAKAERGVVTVMDVTTGEILAMATSPGFNPNNLKNAAIENMGNPVLSDAYEPGSVGKIMTVAAVLEEKVMSPDSKITVPGKLQIYDKTFHDHDKHGILRLTLTGVLAKSSNIGIIKASDKITSQTLFDYFNKFGIGQVTKLEFPGENPGYLPPVDTWSGVTKPNLAFGQGYSVNALQAASVFATIANAGVRVTPKLVAGFVNPSGVFEPTPGSQKVRVISADTARTVTGMMESVVGEGGTAPTARIKGYRVAGKTGTAQTLDPTCACYQGYLASFMGVAPADSPRLVVTVSLLHPRGFSHYGGVLGGPVFKKVMSFALGKLHIPPTGSKSPKFKLTW